MFACCLSKRHCGVVATAFSCAMIFGCATAPTPFPAKPPMWHDPDRRPFAPKPDERYLARRWHDGDRLVFRPIARFFAVDPVGEAVNVNAVDEVPSSSWFENRIGRRPKSPAEVARGACVEPPLDLAGPWRVVSGKPAGNFPGFVIEDAESRRYLLKFDGVLQPLRASAGEAVAARIYHAAGYHVPCTEVVYFDPAVLTIDPSATYETELGKERPLTRTQVNEALEKAFRRDDGRYRAAASRYLPGEPLGPWHYEGRRTDDLNDVVDHEDRRDLRASRLLAAWTDHWDQEAPNTLASWIETGGGRGFILHQLLDFGDCFGALWPGPLAKAYRRGHSYWFDFKQVGADFATFGVLERPWDRAGLGPSGMIFFHYDVARFDPEGWKPHFPNAAFVRMTARDAGWMARIIARFSDEHLRALVRTAKLEPRLERELLRLLIGRRDKILEAYLFGVSPLTEPEIVWREARAELCLADRAAEWRPNDGRRERARIGTGWPPSEFANARVRRTRFDRICVELPPKYHEKYVVVEVWTSVGPRRAPPARVHLRGGRAVGLERPYRHSSDQ